MKIFNINKLLAQVGIVSFALIVIWVLFASNGKLREDRKELRATIELYSSEIHGLKTSLDSLKKAKTTDSAFLVKLIEQGQALKAQMKRQQNIDKKTIKDLTDGLLCKNVFGKIVPCKR